MIEPTRRGAPPALYLEQLALDELGPQAARALESELGAEGMAAARARLSADDARLSPRLDELAPRLMARLERERGEPATPLRQPAAARLGWAVAVLAVVAAALLALRPGVAPTSPAGGEASGPAPVAAGPAEPTRIKGLTPHVLCFRRRGDVVEALADDDVARPGDLLQLGYVAAGRAHGVLLSIDGRGTVSQHFPRPGAADTRLSPGGERLLDRAFELDDAPAFERFVLVTSAAPLDVAEVRHAAEALSRRPDAHRAALLLPEGVEQHSLLLRKVEP